MWDKPAIGAIRIFQVNIHQFLPSLYPETFLLLVTVRIELTFLETYLCTRPTSYANKMVSGRQRHGRRLGSDKKTWPGDDVIGFASFHLDFFFFFFGNKERLEVHVGWAADWVPGGGSWQWCFPSDLPIFGVWKSVATYGYNYAESPKKIVESLCSAARSKF